MKTSTKNPKILKIILLVLLVSILAWLVIATREPFDPGKLEAQLAAEAEPKLDAETLDALIEHFEEFDLRDTEYEEIKNGLKEKQFLFHQDSLLMESAWNVKNQTGAIANDRAKFFEQNKYNVYALVIRLLNAEVHHRRFAHAQIAQIDSMRELTRWLISEFPDTTVKKFFASEFSFYESLPAAKLENKLLLEHCASFGGSRPEDDRTHSLQHIGAGLRLARDLKDRRKEIDLISNLMFTLNYHHSLLNIGLALGEHLLRPIEEIGYVHKKALLHFYRGHCYLDKGQIGKAGDEYRAAQDFYTNFRFYYQIARAYERMGVVNRRLGRLNEALKSYQQCLQVIEAHGVADVFLDYLIGLGLVYAELGETEKANSFYQKALEGASREGDLTRQSIALGNLGQLWLDVGDSQRAFDYTKQAYDLQESNGDPHTTISLSINIIDVLAQTKNFDEAKNWADQTVARLSGFDFALLKGETYLNVGKLQLQLADLEKAADSFSKALAISVAKDAVPQQIEALNMLAETNRRAARLDTAMTYVSRAVELVDKYPYAHQKWNTRAYLARINRDAGDITIAETNFKASIDLIGKVASEIVDNEQRSSFSEKIQPIFEDMVLLQLAKNDDETAFQFAEKERAQVFKVLLESSFETAPDPAPIAALTKLLPTITAPQNFLLSDLQGQLKDNEVVVEYEVTDQQVLAWVIDPDTFETIEIPISRDSLESWVADFRKYTNADSLNDFDGLEKTYPPVESLCRRLYKELLAPVSGFIDESDLIYFIPDEALHYLPFAALMDSSKFLVEQHPIVMAPSAEILCYLLTNKQIAPVAEKRLFAVATDPELTSSFVEVRRVATRYANADTLIGPQVTEEDVRRKLQEQFDVILFSLHGRVNEKRPFYSALVINPDSVSSGFSPTDEHLMTQEIQAEFKLQADLVYLSACESASGRLYRGEGIVGLQRAFLIAGANSVIANLWKVDDGFAGNQTVQFFNAWSRGNFSKAEALRQAQIGLIHQLRKSEAFKKNPHPYLWASVTLAGIPN
jgi:CHAT domain-containing protein/predicted negative regulator of RcsB-dependent stress response